MAFDVLSGIIVGIAGLCIGSFLNAAIFRLEKKKSMAGRSQCMHCGHTLVGKDLVPLLSYLWLRGKCRYCKKKLSIQYPLVELAAGLLFLAVWYGKFSGSNYIEILFLWYVLSVLLAIFVYDLKHYIIPDKWLFPTIAVTLVYDIFLPCSASFFCLANFALGAISVAGFFFIIFLATQGKGIGFGDVKLALLMGLLLGFFGVWIALFIASVTGAVAGISLMAVKKKKFNSPIPFGPFLILGTFCLIFFGSRILELVNNLLLL